MSEARPIGDERDRATSQAASREQAASAGEGDETFSIAELAEAFEVTPRAIRFYEDKGLLHPARQGQTRVYSQRDRARLLLILRGKRVGFSLADIREMLDLYDRKDGQEAQLTVSLNKFRERIETLERQREDIDAALLELRDGVAWIERTLAQKRSEAGEETPPGVIGYGFAADRD